MGKIGVYDDPILGDHEGGVKEPLEGKLAESIVGSGEEWLTELSTDELRDLLLLRREMVEEL